MPKRFYVDTSVWRDFFEDRKDSIRPLGEFAFGFLKKCREEKLEVLVSDAVLFELKLRFSEAQLSHHFSSFEQIIRRIQAEPADILMAKRILKEKKEPLPFNDVLHAVLAKKHGAVLVARDRHFELFLGWIEVKKPEELV